MAAATSQSSSIRCPRVFFSLNEYSFELLDSAANNTSTDRTETYVNQHNTETVAVLHHNNTVDHTVFDHATDSTVILHMITCGTPARCLLTTTLKTTYDSQRILD